MSEHVALNVTYTPKSAADLQENRWIRIEQLQPEDESISVGEAASIIDEMFGIDACDGLSGGGEESAVSEDGTPEDAPDEETVDEIIKDKLLGKDICDQDQYWTAQVVVLRSHQQPGYTIRSETSKVVSTELVTETIRETIDFEEGTYKDLTWPFLGDFSSNLSSDVEVKILGSTVNLSTPSGKVSVKYRTSYERLQIKVPVDEGSVQSEDDSVARPEFAPSALIAFWGDLATACELEQPEQDTGTTQSDLATLCGKTSGIISPGESECFESIEHYQLCNCSRERVNPWIEVAPAECPEKVLGGTYYLGGKEQFDGFVGCDDDDGENVSSPAYYEAKCCEPVPEGKTLPRCRITYAEYKGGAEIEGGAASWLELYGKNTRLIPVLPEDGICGEVITEWKIQGKNCCAGVPELLIDPDTAPEVMTNNMTSYIAILGGLGPFTVSTSSDGLYVGAIGKKTMETNDSMIPIFSTSICGMVAVNVKDSCGQSATHRMRATNGRWVECTGEVPKCAGGAPDPVYIGAYYESISGEYKLWFDRLGSITSGRCNPLVENPLAVCADHCREYMLSVGADDGHCGVWSDFLMLYEDAGCPPGTADTCQCHGVRPVRNWRWVC
jgi:hypothetical protein